MVLLMMYVNLCDRFQRVKISNERSSWMALSNRSPQGSGLGPFLFNTFMNDIFYFMEICELVTYADDNTIRTIATNTVKLVCDAFKQDATNPMEWFAKHFMEKNPSKLQFMLMKSFTTEVIPVYIDI